MKYPVVGLAPMDGVTDAAFRNVIDIYGKPDILYTEFVSVKGLVLGKPAIQRMLLKHKTDTFTVAQFFGNEPEYFYQAAQSAVEKGFDGVDINMGCPDKSVFHHGAGAALILQPDLATKIIFAVKKGVKDAKEKLKIDRHIPVSVKTRIGYKTPQTREWIGHLLNQGLDVICIHARTFSQKYSGMADWDQIGIAVELAKKTETKIFGNGDVKSRQDALNKISKYNVSGVLIGRASLGNPWIFKGVIPTLEERFAALLDHCIKFKEFFPEAEFKIMRKHLAWYMKDFKNAAEVRGELMHVDNIEEVKTILNRVKESI